MIDTFIHTQHKKLQCHQRLENSSIMAKWWIIQCNLQLRLMNYAGCWSDTNEKYAHCLGSVVLPTPIVLVIVITDEVVITFSSEHCLKIRLPSNLALLIANSSQISVANNNNHPFIHFQKWGHINYNNALPL